jgi:hypothetical protein
LALGGRPRVMRMISEHRPEAQMQWPFGRLEKKGILVRRSGVGVVVGHAAGYEEAV